MDREREPDFTIRIDWDSYNSSTLVKELLRDVEKGYIEISLKAKKGSLLLEILIFTAKMELLILQDLLIAYLIYFAHSKKLKKAELIDRNGKDIIPPYVG